MQANFVLEIPRDLGSALDMLALESSAQVVALAGGTNLIVDIRGRRQRPERVIGLSRVHELRGISSDDENIVVGGRTTVSDLLNSPLIAATAPALASAARCFAGQMVRNTATVAGNIACCSPAADLVPPLMSLDAQLTLASKSGTRTVPLDEYFIGYKKTVRRHDELISRISWRRPPENTASHWYKLARRQGDAITITGVAVALSVSGGICTKARIALGAVAPVVMRARNAERMLEGNRISPDMIDAAAAQAVTECAPIDDIRASAEYRRHAVGVLTRRLVSRSWEQLTHARTGG